MQNINAYLTSITSPALVVALAQHHIERCDPGPLLV
jgi:hypothetical protein